MFIALTLCDIKISTDAYSEGQVQAPGNEVTTRSLDIRGASRRPHHTCCFTFKTHGRSQSLAYKPNTVSTTIVRDIQDR